MKAIVLNLIGGPKECKLAHPWPPPPSVETQRLRIDSIGMACGLEPPVIVTERGSWQRVLPADEVTAEVTTFDYEWQGWR